MKDKGGEEDTDSCVDTASPWKWPALQGVPFILGGEEPGDRKSRAPLSLLVLDIAPQAWIVLTLLLGSPSLYERP